VALGIPARHLPEIVIMYHPANNRQGFSLIEVLLAMVILALLTMGISQGLVFARSISETNIREVTANAAASGYLEQLKSMEYATILTSVNDTSVPVPTVLSLGQPDPLLLNQWTTKSVVIDQDPDTGHERRMPLHVRLEIRNLDGAGNGPLLEFSIFYAWEDAKTYRKRERGLRTMRAEVPTF